MAINSPQQVEISRRGFLGEFARYGFGLTLSGLILPKVARAQENEPTNTNSPPPSRPDVSARTATVDEHQPAVRMSRLNLTTAHGVTLGYLATMGNAIARKHGQLDLRDAATIALLETGRLATLQLGGDEGDRKEVASEVKDLFSDLGPAVLYTAIADFTSTNVALEPKTLANKVNGSGDRHSSSKDEWETIVDARPALTKEALDAWVSHKEITADSLSRRLSQMVAITSVTAPFVTTLTSAAFWRDEFDDIAHLCTEIALASEVIRCINNGGEPQPQIEELKSNAAKTATEHLNGSWGYNQLGIALACNIQGLAGVGTPPNIYFLANHFPNEPLAWSKSQLLDVALAESQSLIFASIWLSKVTGEPAQHTWRNILKHQGAALALIANSFTEEELRTLTFGSGDKLAIRLIKHIHKIDKYENITALRDAIRTEIEATPTPFFQISIGQWIDSKLQALRRIKRSSPIIQSSVGEIEDLTAQELDRIDELQRGGFFRNLVESIKTGNQARVTAYLDKYLRWRETRLSQRLTLALTSIAGEAESEEDINEVLSRLGISSLFQIQRLSEDGGKIPAVERELRLLAHTLDKVASFDTRAERLKHATALLLEGLPPERALQQLGFLHREAFIDACTAIAGIAEPVEDDSLKTQAAQREPSAANNEYSAFDDLLSWIKDSWRDPRNLSEDTRDVVRVFASQLPAVHPVAISFTEVLRNYADVKNDRPVTREQLDKILNILPVLGFALASVADNAPGYILLERVLHDLFSQSFGSNVFTKHPSIKTELGYVAKTIASQSGMVFPFSSVSNLLQDGIQVVPLNDAAHKQGFGIRRAKLTSADTTRSHFMHLAAIGTIGLASAELHRLANKAAKP